MCPPPPIGFAKETAEAVPPAVDTTAPTSGVVAKAADADTADADAAETKAAEANAGAKAVADEPATGHEDANSESQSTRGDGPLQRHTGRLARSTRTKLREQALAARPKVGDAHHQGLLRDCDLKPKDFKRSKDNNPTRAPS